MIDESIQHPLTDDATPRRGSATLAPGDPFSRRRFLQVTGTCLISPLLAPMLASATVSPERSLDARMLPFGRSLRVVHLSDVHMGLGMSAHQFRGYMDQVKSVRPDLLVLTGDFISYSMAGLEECVREIARVQPPYGTFATLGNHEHAYGQVAVIEDRFASHGIPLLRNQHIAVPTRDGLLVVAGIDDLGFGTADLVRALRGRPADVPTLLLSHHPEIFPRAAEADVTLTLSGHWHGGQIRFPIPGGYVSVAHLNTPYPEGLFRRGGSLLYVNPGLGTSLLPLRVNAPPEISVLNLF